MTIKSIQLGQAGVSNITPSWLYIETNDTYATVTKSGYLSGAGAEFVSAFQDNMIALVTTKVAQGSAYRPQLVMLQLSHSNGIWSLIAPLSTNATVQQAYVSLTASQVLAAYATPQLLIAAPGAGNVIMLTSARIITEVSTAFAGGGVGVVQYGATINGGGTNALSATIPAAEITAATSQIYTMTGYATTTVTTGITNNAIYFSNQTGAFTGGSGSTLNFALQYVEFAATV